MADINEAIRETILESFSGFHVGQDVPQSIATDFLWFQRQGDVLDDALCYPPIINSVLFDFEFVSKSISSCRNLTEQIKQFIAGMPLHTVTFDVEDEVQRTIHCFDVEDHDDSYIPHLVELDAKLHVGSFRVTAHLGEFIQLT